MTTEDNFTCVFCDEKFDDKEALKVHFRQHADPGQPLFLNKKKISSERRIKSEITDEEKDLIKCDVCPEVFNIVSKALTHIHKAHPEYDVKHFCSWCGQFFNLQQLYQKHVLTHENDKPPQRKEIIHCNKCDVTFYHAAALNYHNKFFHREIAELPNVGDSKKLKLFEKELLPLFYCPFCGAENNNKINLHKHLEDDHVSEYRTQTNVFRCPLCEAIFYQKNAYETHLRYHSSEDVYVWSNESARALPEVYTLETVPPIEETIENFANYDMEPIGFENLLQLSMEFNEEDNVDDSPVPVKKRKKHKKHKKSKKAPITLDEFLNMNSDVFGENIDFQGAEEVPSRMVTKQLGRGKSLGSVAKGNLAPTTLQKLKQRGIVVKKSTNVGVLPKSTPLAKIKPADIKKPAETSKLMLEKLIKQGTHLKIAKTEVKGDNKTSNKPIDKIEQGKLIPGTVSCPKTKLLANSQLTVKSSNDALKKLDVKIKQTDKDAGNIDNSSSEKGTDENTINDNKTCETEPMDEKQELEQKSKGENIIALPFYPLPESFRQQANSDSKFDLNDKIKEITVKSMPVNGNMEDVTRALNKEDTKADVSSNGSDHDDTDSNESDSDSKKHIKHLKGLNSSLMINPFNKQNVATGEDDDNFSNSRDENEDSPQGDETKLSSNSQLTIKTPSSETRKDMSSDSDHSEADVSQAAHKTKSPTVSAKDCPKTKLLSNSQLTIKSSSDNQVKSIQDNDEFSDSDENNTPQDSRKIKNTNCPKRKLLSNPKLTNKSSDDQTKKVTTRYDDSDTEDGEADYQTVCKIKNANYPKTKLLSNSQLTIKSSSDIRGSHDDNDVDDNDVDTPQVAHNTIANCPKTKLLSNTQLTIKSSSDIKGNHDDSDTEDDADTPQSAHDTSVNCPKTKLLSNSQLTIKSSSDVRGNHDDSDTDDDANIPQVAHNTIANCPKTKLLSNSQLTIKSSCDNQTKNTAVKAEDSDCSSDEWDDDNLENIRQNMKPIKILPRTAHCESYPDSDCDDTVLYPKIIGPNLGMNSPKGKLLNNAQLTVKNLKDVSNSICVQKPDTRFMEIDNDEEINHEFSSQSIFKKENRSFRVNRGSKMVNNSQTIKSSSSFKQSNVTIKSSSHNLVSNEKQRIPNDEDNHVPNTARSCKIKKEVQQESQFSSTNKLLSNTQLTVKPPVKRQIENQSSKNIYSKKVNASREYQKIPQSSSNQLTNTINTLKGIKGITIKQEMRAPATIVTQECDDPIDLISSDDDQANTPSTSENNLSKIQNKLGSGITLKSANNVSSSDDKVDDEDDKLDDEDDKLDDEDESEKEIDSDEDKSDKHESIVNKLKTTNLGLSIKSVKSSDEHTPSTSEAAENCDTTTQEPKDASPTPATQNKNCHISNFLSNNKNITLKTSQKVQPERCVSPDSSQALISKPKGKILNKNSNTQSQEIASTSKNEVVSQTVTVKQVQTKTVIQEITTTVTKTIRTVNQTEEVSNQSINHSVRGGQSIVRPNTIQRPQRPVMQRTRIRPESYTPRPGANVIRPATSTIVRAVPASGRPIKAIQVKPSTPVRPPTKKIMPQPSSPSTAKTLKISPNASTVGRKRPTDERSPGPFSCFKKQKDSYFHGEDLEDMLEKHVTTASPHVSSMSQVTKQNFSSMSKVVNSSFQSKGAQMSSEFNASCSQQINKVSTSTNATANANTTAKNSLSIIEKLRQQGLLVKKPALDVQFSDASNDGDMDGDGDD